MDKEKVKEKVLRWQLLAEQLFQEDASVFIKKVNGDIYFCKIILVGETNVSVDVFAPIQRMGNRESIDWLSIETFERIKGDAKR